MQRKEFENRIKSLLPKAADDVVESWAEYATELDQDGTEAAADFYDKNYIALLLVKQRRGEEIATQLFNFGKRFTFNYFELQGAAEKLEAGWSLDDLWKIAGIRKQNLVVVCADELDVAERDLQSCF